MTSRLSKIGARFDEKAERRKHVKEAMKKAISLVPSMQWGKLTYHELTIRDRLPELKERGSETSDGVLLETLYIRGPRGIGSYEYFLRDDGHLTKKHSSKGGVSSEIFYDYCSTFQNQIFIPPYRQSLPSNIYTKEDLLNGTEETLPRLKADSEKEGEVGRLTQDELARLTFFLVGFGDAALKQDDVKTAVRAYQIAEVTETEHVATKLESYARREKEYAIEVRQTLKDLQII